MTTDSTLSLDALNLSLHEHLFGKRILSQDEMRAKWESMDECMRSWPYARVIDNQFFNPPKDSATSFVQISIGNYCTPDGAARVREKIKERGLENAFVDALQRALWEDLPEMTYPEMLFVLLDASPEQTARAAHAVITRLP